MRFYRLRDRFERLLEGIVLVLITALAAIVVLGVGFRKAGAALVWYDEVASILLAWLTYYGASLAALKRAHIAFPKVVQRLPRVWRRWITVTREVIVIGFFLIAAWAGVQVLMVLGNTTLVSLPWMPNMVTQSVIPIGAALFVIAELLSLTYPATWVAADRAGEEREP